MRLPYALFLLLAFSIGSHAQVPVSQEPRHHPVFQNDKVRLLNVLLPAGDTTQYHIHSTPSLFVFFTSTTTGSQLQGGQPSIGRSTAGTLLFENLAPPHMRVHRVWNIDTATFHVMDIELLSNNAGFKEKPLALPHLQVAIDTPWARAYNVMLKNQNDFSIQDAHRSFVMIAIDSARIQLQKGGTTQDQTVAPGTFFWIAPGQKFAMKNAAAVTARFALIELPR